jgi:signal transduction histidine kinase
LSPVNLDSTGLADALAELARRTTEFGHVKCALSCPEPVLLEDSAVARHLFRIAQEAVNNAMKHAGAKKIVMTLSSDEEWVCLTVSDNGKGLPAAKKPGRGIGLQVMKHRAGVIGADLEIESKPGKGVKLSCRYRRHGR